MIAPELLNIVCCPESRQRLNVADIKLIEQLNQRIVAGTLTNRAGQPVSEKLDGGLVRDDGKILYAIRRDIPILLEDEGIPLPQG